MEVLLPGNKKKFRKYNFPSIICWMKILISGKEKNPERKIPPNT